MTAAEFESKVLNEQAQLENDIRAAAADIDAERILWWRMVRLNRQRAFSTLAMLIQQETNWRSAKGITTWDSRSFFQNYENINMDRAIASLPHYVTRRKEVQC